MTPNSALDKFRLLEIKQQLDSELQVAMEQARLASTEDEKRNGLDAYLQALQRYTEFAKGLEPEEVLRKSCGAH